MSRINDSLTDGGLGILPLQDHRPIAGSDKLHQRLLVAGVRVVDRLIDASKGEIGTIVEDAETRGDLSGFLYWDRTSRPIGAWREVFPAIRPLTTGVGGGGGGASSGGGGGPAGEVPPNSRTPFGATASSTSIAASSPAPRPGLTSDAPRSGGGGGSFDMVPERAVGDTTFAGSGTVLPIKDEVWLPDGRFQEIAPTAPGGAAAGEEDPFPAFPGGHVGIVVAATNEDKQIVQFHPTDPRLVAPHYGGAERNGTFVVDLSGDGDHSAQRKAHLQAFMRVVRKPKGMFSLEGSSLNSISWNIGLTGRGGIVGGFVTDKGGRQTRHALVSVRDGGPLDVGAHDDVHHLGEDGDGNPINPLHFSTLSLFRGLGKDGPLLFEPEDYIPPYSFPYLSFTYLRFNAGRPYMLPRDQPTASYTGVWRWETEVPLGSTETRNPTTDTPGPIPGPSVPPGPPGPGPTTPGGGDPGGPTTPGGGGDQSFSLAPVGARSIVTLGPREQGLVQHTLITHREVALPGISAVPQPIVAGEEDLRYTTHPSAAAMAGRARQPTSGRLEGFGTQLPGSPEFDYTEEPGSSRSPGGTTQGGFIFLPPELDLSDSLDNWSGVAAASPTTVLFGPGVSSGHGSPDLATGDINEGFKTTYDHAAQTLSAACFTGPGVSTEYQRVSATVHRLKATGSDLELWAGSGGSVSFRSSAGAAVASVSDAGAAQFATVRGNAFPTYTTANVAPTRSFDADATTLDEIADVLGTLLSDLAAIGLITV